ncbi:rRNA maturation RNase YbeY [Candidatus Campbellbacteria bacterium]|nr:rRNA maturation RNase YbeY [Candidatus Campbellbacteria bacterium]|tara:strand:+ start:502 stop:897 length:396 start_codon:yes stop_codon:yes gene_type:complete
MTIVEYNNFTIQRRTKGTIPNVPFLELKNALLGKKYELSLVFPTLKESIELHTAWKNKSNPVNILSFPLDDNEGEIFITLSKARSEARKYGRTYHNHLIFLFIHGCLHLKGMVHGDKMEEAEKFWCSKFFI